MISLENNILLHEVDMQHPHEKDRDALRNLFNLWHHNLAMMDETLFPNVDERGFYETI